MNAPSNKSLGETLLRISTILASLYVLNYINVILLEKKLYKTNE